MTIPAQFAVAVMVLRQTDEGAWEAVVVARKDDHTRWSLPGGKVDPGEASPQAALRELLEETGISILGGPNGPVYPNTVLPVHRLVPQGSVLDSGGYLTTFYLLDTTGLDLPEAFRARENEAPVKWGSITLLFEGPFGEENFERLRKMGIVA